MSVSLLSSLPLALLSAAALATPLAAAPDLAAYRWKARLLVVIAPDPGDPRLGEQRRIAEADHQGFAERDLTVLEAVGADAVALRRRFGVPPEAFRAILVGKDGAAKLVSDRPLGPDRLFREIDAMPMRQDEMRRNEPKGRRS
ncbi:MAG: DUF4174 domain-containing protein [Methylobacteriaceae bacterium]|nr:DUF4174 domain-containing protein [Methylobacteriaceae bacterium]